MTARAQYVLAAYVFERREGPPVSPGRLATSMGRSPAASTEMLQRLADADLLTLEPYQGATLTAAGRERGEELFDQYRTLARFLRDVLEVGDYHAEAWALVGLVSPTVVDRLEATVLSEVDGGPAADLDAASMPLALEGSTVPDEGP